MCYLLRSPRTEAERGGTTPSPKLHSPRPRWIAAISATAIAGLAVAAIVLPPSTPALESAVHPPLAPVTSRAAAVPSAGVVEQGFAPVDDEVPTATNVVKAGAGNCHHGL